MINNELINRNAKRGFIDTVILGHCEKYGFIFSYVLKVKHVNESQTGIVIRKTCTSGGYQDLDISEVSQEVQERAYERLPGFMEEYNNFLL